MKRVADRQISKDDVDGRDEEYERGSNETRRVDEATLAVRKIRGLPKRLGSVGNNASSSNGSLLAAPPESTPKIAFNGFSGFGAKSTVPSAFSFMPSSIPVFASESTPTSTSGGTTTAFSFSNSTNLPVPSQTTSLFGEITPPKTSKPDIQPAVAPDASNTAKSIASFLSNDTTPTNKEATASPEPCATPINKGIVTMEGSCNNTLMKYYSSLRGLNVSLLSAAQTAVDNDAFADLGCLLQNYQKLRGEIQKGHDNSIKPANSPFATPSTSTPNDTNGNSDNLTSVTKPLPILPALSSGFSFGPPPSTTSKPLSMIPKSEDVNKEDLPIPKLPFAFPTSTNIKGAFTPPASNGFSFAKPPASSTGPTPSLPFALAETTSPSGLFGSSSIVPLTTDEKSDKPKESGTQASAPKSAFGSFSGFGQPSPQPIFGSAPTGLRFGSSGDSAAGGGTPPLFGFNKPTQLTEKEAEKIEGGEEVTITEDSRENHDSQDSAKHDEEGEGEETEETLHAVRVKAYRLKASDEIGNGWVELGIGILRLKKDEESGKHRLLMRNSSTGKIHINFNLYPSMSISRSKKTLTFIGHDAGVARTYSLRASSDTDAKALKDAVDTELAQLK